LNNFFAPISNLEIIKRPNNEDELDVITPVPEDVTRPNFFTKSLGNPTEIYSYYLPDGKLANYIARYETDKGKSFLPFTYCKCKNGTKSWKHKNITDKRPLYGCEQLSIRNKANVLIVEGEKTANAAKAIFPDYVVISWSGGSNAIQKSDWSVLYNRTITLWPDNDVPGKKAMSILYDILKEQSCNLSIVSTPKNFPASWDLADDIPNHKGVEYLRELLENTKDKKTSTIGTELVLSTPTAWTEAVSGEAILDELVNIFNKHLILPEHSANTLALWVLFTYCFECFEHSPRLLIHSPEKRCGKTTLLMLLNFLCCRPIRVASLTASAMFRTIETYKPTLLIDEADSFLNDKEELRGVINEGHTKGGGVIRTIETSKTHSVRFFSCFCPCAIAGIGKVTDTIADRSILVPMRRKLLGETVCRLRGDKSIIFEPIKQKCARWVYDNQIALSELDPEIENHISDRTADNWRPLLIIAELAGKKWVDLAKASMNVIDNIGHINDESSIRVLLLKDIKSIFEDNKCYFISSQELCSYLSSIGDSPWGEYQQNRSITQRQLAIILKDFGISPYQKRIGDKNIRGYDKAQFNDAFTRYLPTSATSLQPSINNKITAT